MGLFDNALWVGFIFAALIIPVFAFRHYVQDGGKFPARALADLGLKDGDIGRAEGGHAALSRFGGGLIVVLLANWYLQSAVLDSNSPSPLMKARWGAAILFALIALSRSADTPATDIGEGPMSLSYIILGCHCGIGGYLIYAYNALVKNKNLVAEGWSGIDVQLRRRADLIPNLVETVKGYAAHEDKLFRDIAELRAKSIAGRDGQPSSRK